MSSLRYTLITEGTSDRALLPILRWLLLETGTPLPLDASWADPYRMPRHGGGMAERLRFALEYYPCDLLFVHRDAEGQEPEMRRDEIETAVLTLSDAPPAVCVVPIRMTEAWLLIDEDAIRRAATNPHERTPLSLPAINQLESMPNPKAQLSELSSCP